MKLRRAPLAEASSGVRIYTSGSASSHGLGGLPCAGNTGGAADVVPYAAGIFVSLHGRIPDEPDQSADCSDAEHCANACSKPDIPERKNAFLIHHGAPIKTAGTEVCFKAISCAIGNP